MATVIIILKDYPAGGASMHTSFTPAVGQKLTLAQASALDIIHAAVRTLGQRAEPLAAAEVTQI